MHPAHFLFLSSRYAIQRKVVNTNRTYGGTMVIMECGHTYYAAPHFNVDKQGMARCSKCAGDIVRERHADEFKGEK